MSGDKIHLYPKTLCACTDCKNKYPIPQGDPTNLAVRGCQVSPFFSCHSRTEFSDQRNIPAPPQGCEKGWDQLNPQVYTEKQDPLFSPLKCATDKDKFCVDTFISPDPRGINSIRGMEYTRVDRPSINGNVQLKNIYKKKWNDYGVGSKPYSEINDGQIMYYTDKSIANAFFSPVYGTTAKETPILFKDPMDSMKPEYNREPVINTENPATQCVECYPYCLSWMQDTQSHREDLMSYQMRKRNQERWMPRWGAK